MPKINALRSCCAAAIMLAAPDMLRADLYEYIKKPEPAFSWKLKTKQSNAQGTIYSLDLVSQTWQGIVWSHQIQVHQPAGISPTSTLVLLNTGGRPNPVNAFLALEMAKKIKAPVAFLYGIPNQPLLGGKKEDTLIAETYVRYLETKDENWPLLFPMVKSVVKAMDALQEFSRTEWKEPVTNFIVTGGSKRGWTSWLTAASGDPRVKAIAPMVIDMLNSPKQMPYQLECYGKYSEMIKDYTDRGLVPMPDTPEARKLWSMVDPYAYRDKLTLPKFIINGTNDPYWTVDAMNLYWDDLKGDKWVLYVPNAGHDLQQTTATGRKDHTRVLSGLGAFARHQIAGKTLPALRWKHADANGKLRLTVESDPAPLGARIWVAQAPTKDFRKATWTEQPAGVEGKTVVGEVSPPSVGYLAFYGELDYVIDDLPYHLSTQIRVVGKK